MNFKNKPVEAQKKQEVIKSKNLEKNDTEASLVQYSNNESNIGIANAEKMINSAITKGLPVESLEKLLEMRDKIKKEWAREQYYFWLSRLQGMMPEIKKNKKVFDKHGKHRYSFTPLDEIVKQVKEPLKECGFSYNLKTRQTENNVTVVCYARHLTGHMEETEVTVPIDPDAFMSIAQKVASAITFAKRYAFCNAFGIMTADEDNEKAKDEDKSGKDEVLMKALSVKDKMTADEFKHFKDLKNNDTDYTEVQKVMDLELIKTIEER